MAEDLRAMARLASVGSGTLEDPTPAELTLRGVDRTGKTSKAAMFYAASKGSMPTEAQAPRRTAGSIAQQFVRGSPLRS
jgi:hypothetical protein